MAFVLQALGMISAEAGHYDRAQEHCGHALAILEKTLRPEHPNVPNNLNNLGLIYAKNGRYP